MIRKKNNIVKLDTLSTSLIIDGETGEYLYYGKRIKSFGDLSLLYAERDWAGNREKRSLISQLGDVDFREKSVILEYEDGTISSSFLPCKVRLCEKPEIEGLPSSYGSDSTVCFEFVDNYYKSKLSIFYSTFPDCDAIAVSARITSGKCALNVKRLASVQLDLNGDKCSLTTLEGAWGSERNVVRTQLSGGVYVNDSKTGSSSHFRNPFVMLENEGGFYAFNLVYSGNHKTCVECERAGKTRVVCGMSDFMLDYSVPAGETFCTPEAVIAYSPDEDGISAAMHAFVGEHIIRGRWKGKERPVLLNNWEGTYFDFDAEKILSIAGKAKGMGVELFVLDDGWFGKRNDDSTSLGDWFDNEEKTGGLRQLSDAIREMGLDFGIWVEPEMISEVSELYEKHPEYTMKSPKRIPQTMRNQLMLNLADERVQGYIIRAISKVITMTKAAYIKWDYNRHITDAFSKGVRSGEYYHRYILGLYSVLDALTKKFPSVLFESCASGGGRFDLGMLCFMPQTWTSDNTDARHRVDIQWGTTLAYPQSTMACHVSACPSHQSGNTTPLETRFDVCLQGQLGYELDPTKMSEEETATCREQVEFYKNYRSLLQFGRQYHIGDVSSDVCGFISVDSLKKQAVCVVVQKNKEVGRSNFRFKMKGLDENAMYSVKVRGEEGEILVGGDILMNGELNLDKMAFNALTANSSNAILTKVFILEKVPQYKIRKNQ